MDMKKSLLLVSLLLIFALALGGCSSKQEATAPEPVPAPAPESDRLVVHGDLVGGPGGCVLNSRYAIGEKVVFRMIATDPLTGEMARDAKLQVHIGNGETLDLKLGKHGKEENSPEFWTVSYVIPEGTPEGTLGYHVTAELNGKKGEFRPFNVAPSLLTVVAAAPADEAKEEEKK